MTLKIEVFSAPGCSKCGHAKTLLRRIVEEIGARQVEWREVNILDEMDYAVELGVLSTPAIAFNGTLKFTGLPSQKKLRAALEASMAEAGHD